MNPAQRAKYFKEFWPAACAAKGWPVKDDKQRRFVTLQCMELVGGPRVTTSDEEFAEDEITALFCYLDHLAHQDDLDRAARWVDCQTDYHAYGRARQSDWHEGETYGHGKRNKLQRDRFAGATSAAGEPLEPFDPKAINQRHLTMANRHRAKQRKQRAAATGQDLASHAPESVPTHEPDPAYVPPKDAPF